MDTASAFETQSDDNGVSSTSMLLGVGAFIVLFLVVLLVINVITNKEEGTLAGIDFNTLGDQEMSDVISQQVDDEEKSL
jgi:hypothetical protein